MFKSIAKSPKHSYMFHVVTQCLTFCGNQSSIFVNVIQKDKKKSSLQSQQRHNKGQRTKISWYFLSESVHKREKAIFFKYSLECYKIVKPK